MSPSPRTSTVVGARPAAHRPPRRALARGVLQGRERVRTPGILEQAVRCARGPCTARRASASRRRSSTLLERLRTYRPVDLDFATTRGVASAPAVRYACAGHPVSVASRLPAGPVGHELPAVARDRADRPVQRPVRACARAGEEAAALAALRAAPRQSPEAGGGAVGDRPRGPGRSTAGNRRRWCGSSGASAYDPRAHPAAREEHAHPADRRGPADVLGARPRRRVADAGLTGWSESGWSSAAAFDLLMPGAGARTLGERVLSMLKSRGQSRSPRS